MTFSEGRGHTVVGGHTVLTLQEGARHSWTGVSDWTLMRQAARWPWWVRAGEPGPDGTRPGGWRGAARAWTRSAQDGATPQHHDFGHLLPPSLGGVCHLRPGKVATGTSRGISPGEPGGVERDSPGWEGASGPQTWRTRLSDDTGVDVVLAAASHGYSEASRVPSTEQSPGLREPRRSNSARNGSRVPSTEQSPGSREMVA
jgi:hypothetical protein